MKKIIYDCDNTMGLKSRDIDDGLTILYLLGREDIDLLGITTTFGNDTIDVVYDATRNLLNEIDHGKIPLLKGDKPENRKSEAAEFLASVVDKHTNSVTILATGALTNLYGAYLLDRDFFNKVKEIIVMGGITEPLFIKGKKVDELNFSCDPEATYHVLNSPAPTTVITGNLCLNALFGEDEIRWLEENINIPAYKYIYKHILPWLDFMEKHLNLRGFYNWDVLAGVYSTSPDLYKDQQYQVISSAEHLETGFLHISTEKDSGYILNIPDALLDIRRFNDVVFEAWKNVRVK